MTAKEYLSQARLLDDRIKSKIQILEELNAMATKCTATYTDMPKSPSGSTSRLEDTVIKIISLQEEINQDINTLVDIKADIYSTISKVTDPLQRLVLEKRYLCNMTWERIANDLSVEERYVYMIHGKALNSINLKIVQ